MLLILPTAFMNQLDIMLTKLEELADNLETKVTALENLPEEPVPYDVDAESLKLLNQMAAVIGEIELINASTDHYKSVRDILKLDIIEHTVGDPLPNPADYPDGYRLSISTADDPAVLNIEVSDFGTLDAYGKTITIIDRDETFATNPLTVILGTLDDSGEVHGSIDVIGGSSDLQGRIDLNGASGTEYHILIKDADSSGIYLENLTDQFAFYLGALDPDTSYAFGRSDIRRLDSDTIEMEKLDGSVSYFGRVPADGTKVTFPFELTDDAMKEAHLIVSDNAVDEASDVIGDAVLTPEFGNEGFLRISSEVKGISPMVLDSKKTRGAILLDDPEYGAINLISFYGNRFDQDGDVFMFGIHNWTRKGLAATTAKPFTHRDDNGGFHSYFEMPPNKPRLINIFNMQARKNLNDTDVIDYKAPGGTLTSPAHVIAVKGLAFMENSEDGFEIEQFAYELWRLEEEDIISISNKGVNQVDPSPVNNEGDIILPGTATDFKIITFPHNATSSINSFLTDLHITIYYELNGTYYFKAWRWENQEGDQSFAEARGVGTTYESNDYGAAVVEFATSGYYELDASRYGSHPDIRGINYAVVDGVGIRWAECFINIAANIATGDYVGFGDGNNTIVPGSAAIATATLELRSGRDGLGVAGFDGNVLYYIYPDGYYHSTLHVDDTIRDVHCFNKNGNIYICALVKRTGNDYCHITTVILPDVKVYQTLANHGAAYATALPIFNVYELADEYDNFQLNTTIVEPAWTPNVDPLANTAVQESSFGERVALIRIDTLNTDDGMSAIVIDLADIVGEYAWMLRLPKPL